MHEATVGGGGWRFVVACCMSTVPRQHGARTRCTTCFTGDAAIASPSPTTTAPPRATSPNTITAWCSAPSRSEMTCCSKSSLRRRYAPPSRDALAPSPPRMHPHPCNGCTMHLFLFFLLFSVEYATFSRGDSTVR